MIRKLFSAFAASLVLSVSLAAQDCSQLTTTVVDGGDTQTLTFDVTGSAA